MGEYEPGGSPSDMIRKYTSQWGMPSKSCCDRRWDQEHTPDCEFLAIQKRKNEEKSDG